MHTSDYYDRQDCVKFLESLGYGEYMLECEFTESKNLTLTEHAAKVDAEGGRGWPEVYGILTRAFA